MCWENHWQIIKILKQRERNTKMSTRGGACRHPGPGSYGLALQRLFRDDIHCQFQNGLCRFERVNTHSVDISTEGRYKSVLVQCARAVKYTLNNENVRQLKSMNNV